jgi:hypothetical protein
LHELAPGADLFIDPTGGTRALFRVAEDQGLGRLTLDDLGEGPP